MQQRENVKMQQVATKQSYVSMRFLEYATKVLSVAWLIVRIVLMFTDIKWLSSVETGLAMLLIINVALFIEESRRRFAVIAMFMKDVKAFVRDVTK